MRTNEVKSVGELMSDSKEQILAVQPTPVHRYKQPTYLVVNTDDVESNINFCANRYNDGYDNPSQRFGHPDSYVASNGVKPQARPYGEVIIPAQAKTLYWVVVEYSDIYYKTKDKAKGLRVMPIGDRPYLVFLVPNHRIKKRVGVKSVKSIKNHLTKLQEFGFIKSFDWNADVINGHHMTRIVLCADFVVPYIEERDSRYIAPLPPPLHSPP